MSDNRIALYRQPESPEEYLEHYGVNGMKWGVIKKDESSGNQKIEKKDTPKKRLTPRNDSETSSKNRFMAVAKANEKKPKLSTKEQAEALAENNQKFNAKFDPPENKKTLADYKPTPTQVKVALGAAAVGLFLYSAYSGQKILNTKPGKPVSLEGFQALVYKSKAASWNGSGFVKPSSFLQDDFVLPKGHEFFRISTFAESDWSPATYCTPSVDDFNRYVGAFRGEKIGFTEFYKVTFKAEREIRVPSLATRLSALKEVLESASPGSKYDDETVLQKYGFMCGGSWDSPTAKSLIQNLVSKGYSAIIDDMDAGVIGEKPLVLIDPTAVGSKVTARMSKAAIKLAETSITEISNRK